MKARLAVLSVSRRDPGPSIQSGVGLCRVRFSEALRASGLDVVECELDWPRTLRSRVAKLGAELSCGWPFYSAQREDCERVREVLRRRDFQCVVVQEVETAAALLPVLASRDGSAKWILYSHGLFSQDHFYDFPSGGVRSLLKRAQRLSHHGRLQAREQSILRAFDAVWVLNEQELEIARWLGAKELRVLPQSCIPDELHRRPVKGRFGFVGSLTHVLNLEGLDRVIAKLALRMSPAVILELRIVGTAPERHVRKWSQYRWIEMLGRLSDAELAREASSWSAMIHPIFVWGRGRHLKVAKALEWGLPLITTHAGARGYPLKEGRGAILANTVDEFVDAMLGAGLDRGALANVAEAGRRLRDSELSTDRVSRVILEAIRGVLTRRNGESRGTEGTSKTNSIGDVQSAGRDLGKRGPGGGG